ncbi:MAG: hypothetical protein AB1671_28860 [Thermodesulfobacteriota bacterium]
MSAKALFSHTITTASLVASLFFLGQSPPVQAGCGCDKPPPAPAAVIPNVGFPGMSVTLFHDSLQDGQTWNIAFHNGKRTATTRATVVVKRALTDPTGETLTPQLVVPVPPNVPAGPTRIVASLENGSFVVPEEAFTVIAKPVVVSEQDTEYKIRYTTGVGADGALYISVGGLDKVCQAMEFDGLLKKYPLRFTEEDVVITNAQGFLIEALGAHALDHAVVTPGSKEEKDSDRLFYFRHSFEQYCADHLPGGADEVDPNDPNWHLDGTPHVDYSTLIFAVGGRFDDGSFPKPGSASFMLELKTTVVDEGEPAEHALEREDEVKGAKKGKKDK